MNNKKDIYKVLAKSYREDVLRSIYLNQPVTMRELVDLLKPICRATIEKARNELKNLGLTKCIKNPESDDGRGRVYVIKDVETVSRILTLSDKE